MKYGGRICHFFSVYSVVKLRKSSDAELVTFFLIIPDNLIQQIVLEVAIRDRQWSVARCLLAERTHLREAATAAFTVHAAARIKQI